MIKVDMVNLLVRKSSIQNLSIAKETAIQAVDLITDCLGNALSSGNRVELRGFGVFELRPRKSGLGRNIRTGASIRIPKGQSVRFKPGKDLRDIDMKTNT